MDADYWEKNKRTFEWELHSGSLVLARFDYAWIVPWSVRKIEALAEKFGSIPAGLVNEIPDEVFSELPDTILDVMRLGAHVLSSWSP